MATVAEKQSEGFEPRGLAGYRVYRDPSRWTGCPDNCWFFRQPAELPQTFSWDEATGDHTVPVYRDWAMGPRKSAKGAVAAAHEFDRWVQGKLAAIAKAEGR